MHNKLLLLFLYFISSIGYSQISFGNDNILIRKAYLQSSVTEIISSDLNGDGFKDLIMISPSLGTINVYSNFQGDYTSTQPTVVIENTSEYPQGVSIIDIDNDGLQDIVACNNGSDKINWFRNQGNLNFSTITTLVTGIDGPFLTVISDIDNDGLKDIVVGLSSNNSVIWLKNNGSGTFMNGQTLFVSAGSNINKIICKDLNNDGLPEIIVGNANSNVYWKKNLGNGLFGTSVQLANSNSGKSFVFEDVNNDNYPDYVSTSSTSVVRQLNQFGNTFATSQSTNIGTSLNEINFKDVDYDGIADIVGSVASGISYSKRLANGTFTTVASLIFVTPASIFIVDDVNNDSFNDFIIPSYGTTDISLKKTSAYMGTSVSTSYNEKVISFFNIAPFNVQVADLDNDGKNDIVANYGTIVWNKNNGGGLFTSYKRISEYYTTGTSTLDIEINDMDNDNDLDVVASTNTGLKVYYNNGIGDFTLGYFLALAHPVSYSRDVEIADLNGDSLKDIVLCFSGGSGGNITMAWIPNLTGATFGSFTTLAVNFSNISQVSLIEFADMDGDNDVDIISYSKGSSRFHLHINNGSGSFTYNAISDAVTEVDNFVLEDYDNDGDKDIISCSNYNLMMLLKNNNGIFANSSIVHLNTSDAFELVDINYDGLKDIVEISTESSTQFGTVKYYLNNGLGGFGNHMVLSSSTIPSMIRSIAIGDLNNDGKPDIVNGLYTNYGVNYILNTSIPPSLGPCGATGGYATFNMSIPAPTVNTSSGIDISNVSGGNTNELTMSLGYTQPPESNYSGASGGLTSGCGALAAPFNPQTSSYLEFTLKAQTGYNVVLNGISFGSKSALAGPLAYTLRSSINNFTTTIASGTLTNNFLWTYNTPTVIPTSSTNGAPITFRLYGHNGVGTPSTNTPNWFIDDLTLNVSAVGSSILSSPVTITICSGDAFSYTPTTNYTGTVTWTRAAVAGISNAAITTPQSANLNEVLINTSNAPVNVIYQFRIATATCYLVQNVTVIVGNCSSVVNLLLFIQGYYDSGAMRSIKFNQDGVSPATDVEIITVELHNSTTPNTIAYTTTAMLKTDGTLVCTYPNVPNGSYFIAVKGSNMIQTWSANSVLIGSTPLTYNFTDAINKAYGNNMVELDSGVFGFYSGDINQDETIDASDVVDLANDVENSAFGVLITDLNGDGSVDNEDIPFMINNSENSIFCIKP